MCNLLKRVFFKPTRLGKEIGKTFETNLTDYIKIDSQLHLRSSEGPNWSVAMLTIRVSSCS